MAVVTRSLRSFAAAAAAGILVSLEVVGAYKCQTPLPIRAGASYRWPQSNPGMVAPVSLTFDYQVYRQPLQAEHTGDAILIRTPPNFFAGFNLTDSAGKAEATYHLRAIEIRKPGKQVNGGSQQLSHVLEAVLMHENFDKNTWASVVIPFSVGADASRDMLSSLLANAKLPRKFGQQEFLLMRSAQPLNLNTIFSGVAFHSFWTSLPTPCVGIRQEAQQFMRNESIITTPSAFTEILAALETSADGPPIYPPEDTWMVGTCLANEPCTALEGENLTSRLQNLKKIQSDAVVEVRAKKQSMDEALLELENVTTDSYNNAVASRSALHGAASRLGAAQTDVKKVSGWKQKAVGAKWSSTPPSLADAAGAAASTSSQAGGGAPSPAPAESTPAAAAGPGENSSDASAGQEQGGGSNESAAQDSPPGAASLLHMGTGNAAKRAPSAQGDCFALERSPIAIDSFSVRRQQAAAAAGQLREPILFQKQQRFGTAASDGKPVDTPSIQLYNTGDYLRAMAPPDAGSPLGAFLLDGPDGQPLDVVFADVHVPGEHVFDGQAVAAEVQLVHLPKGGGPAISVAVRLDEVHDSDGVEENPWLQRLVDALPIAGKSSAAKIAPEGLAALHPALRRGSASEYFHYNGTLTRTPCRPAEWYLLEEVGRVSSTQLASLRRALPHAVAAPTRKQFAAVGLVTEGVRRPATSAGATAGAAPQPDVSLLEQPASKEPGKLRGLLGKFQRHLSV